MLNTLNLTARLRGDVPLYELDAMNEWGVDAFFTGRGGGVSASPYDSLNLGTHVGDDPTLVAENRRRVAAASQLDVNKLVTTSQVHGAQVNDVDQWNGEPLVGDSLVCTRDDVALVILVADCIPLLFVDTASTRFAVAHAGWRGLMANVIATTLAHFENPDDVRVVIGPHISPAKYQVGPEVAQHFLEVDGAVLADVGDRSRLDLAAIALDQLVRGGLDVSSITRCSPGTDEGTVFFSDRAQRPCGRFALVVRRFYDASPKEGNK
ncbi:MAG: peptidoglycan editing factor PgeF [Acidimicrobiaceae bacterium]|nr:peptidoglycan editing factor PgeF [Acidimicrobiaceae bacterium]